MFIYLIQTSGLIFALASCLITSNAVQPPAASVSQKLLKHQAAFEKPQLIKISKHVTVAYGYTMSNIIFIEGDNGVFVFDTGMRVEKAQAALVAYRQHSRKPIIGVAYSHGHGDHTGGIRAFIPEGSDIPLYAQRNALRYLADINSATSKVFRLRAVQQLGLILPEGETGTVGSGGGPIVKLGGTVSYITPSHLFDDELSIDLGRVTVRLVHAPGDLDDGIAAWIPQDHVLLTGDTVVGTHTYPILSTPRYEKGRSAEAYIQSINQFRDYDAAHLVGGHGLPINGKDQVAHLIKHTHLVGRYILDETLRQINNGKTPQQIAADLQVPAQLTGGEEFADYYHRLNWIVRGVYHKEMGWYGGDPLELVALPPKQQAARLVTTMGGEAAVLALAEIAYQQDDYRWAATLATQLLTINPSNDNALSVKANSLRGIAFASDSANERNYLLSEADLMLGDIGMNVIFGQAFGKVSEFFSGPTLADTALAGPSSAFISKLRIRGNSSATVDRDISITINIRDRDENYQLSYTDGIIIYDRPSLRLADASISLNHQSLVLLADAHISWQKVLKRDDVTVNGDHQALHDFFENLIWH